MVAEIKKKVVAELEKDLMNYPIIGVVNLEGLPASQFSAMRAELRGKVKLFMTKKSLMKIAVKNIASKKSGIAELEKLLVGMPALLLTKESPFKLSRTLAKSKTPAPAKGGQIAPADIMVPAGGTSFAPGPIISELSGVGLEVGVVSGKIAIKKDKIIVKKGEEISRKVADVLTRLDIKPMTIGLDLVAAYENGVIYDREVLSIDEAKFKANMDSCVTQAFNLAFNITWTTKQNIKLLIAKSYMDAKALGYSQDIIDSGMVDDLLAKAHRSMLSVKSAGNIQ